MHFERNLVLSLALVASALPGCSCEGDVPARTDSGPDAIELDTGDTGTGDIAPGDTDPDAEPDVEPDVEPDTEPDAEPDADPDVDPDADPDVDPDADPNAGVPGFMQTPTVNGAAGGHATSPNFNLTFSIGDSVPPMEGTDFGLNQPPAQE